MSSLERQIVRLFNKAIGQYELVAEGDHILIGLSGGKDSMALLQLMASRYRPRPLQTGRERPWATVEAAFVRMTNIPYQNDETYLEDFARQHGIRLHVVETAFDESTDRRHTHCFLCSWMRRKALFNLANELGCNKIALGHNKDDLIQTALMNMTFVGRFEAMRPRMQMDKWPMTIIRPLCLVRERDVAAFASEQGYRRQVKNCPYEDASRRYDMKHLIAQLEEMNPDFDRSVFHALGL